MAQLSAVRQALCCLLLGLSLHFVPISQKGDPRLRLSHGLKVSGPVQRRAETQPLVRQTLELSLPPPDPMSGLGPSWV